MLAAAAASAALPALGSQSARFSISLAQWSLHRTFFGNALAAGFAAFGQTLRTEPESVLQGDRHPLEFAAIARNEFGIGAIEYVNTFFYGHAKDSAYLDELRRRADDNGVTSLLIMIDAVGALGAPDDATRAASIENHRPWLAAAKHLGCRAIRVNAASSGAKAEQQKLAADGLSALAAHAAIEGLDVLVENHGGWSSDGAWLAGVIRMADQPNLGTLPDFGNFRVSSDNIYDRYLGVTELMPFAKAVSAKSYDFDDAGNETTIDYPRMMKIVLDAGYRGYVGVEYEGSRLSEFDGIRATQHLLEKIAGQ
jgi:sugar phosphate isomerase/epimerase